MDVLTYRALLREFTTTSRALNKVLMAFVTTVRQLEQGREFTVEYLAELKAKISGVIEEGGAQADQVLNLINEQHECPTCVALIDLWNEDPEWLEENFGDELALLRSKSGV